MGGRNLHDIGLENLRFGIVEQAVDDYFSLLAGFITRQQTAISQNWNGSFILTGSVFYASWNQITL